MQGMCLNEYLVFVKIHLNYGTNIHVRALIRKSIAQMHMNVTNLDCCRYSVLGTGQQGSQGRISLTERCELILKTLNIRDAEVGSEKVSPGLWSHC